MLSESCFLFLPIPTILRGGEPSSSPPTRPIPQRVGGHARVNLPPERSRAHSILLNYCVIWQCPEERGHLRTVGAARPWEQSGPSRTCLAQTLPLALRPPHKDVVVLMSLMVRTLEGKQQPPCLGKPPEQRAAWPHGGQGLAIAGRVSVGCDCHAGNGTDGVPGTVSVGCDCHPGNGTNGVPAGVWCHTGAP